MVDVQVSRDERGGLDARLSPGCKEPADGFIGKRLEQDLRAAGIDTLIMVG